MSEQRPSARHWELAEIALEVCADTCQAGATLRNKGGLDPLAREYLEAAEALRLFRQEIEKGSSS